MIVLVPTGDHTGLFKFLQASTTMTRPLVPVTVKPNRFVRTPKLGAVVCTCGFQRTVGRPPNAGPQQVVPGR